MDSDNKSYRSASEFYYQEAKAANILQENNTLSCKIFVIFVIFFILLQPQNNALGTMFTRQYHLHLNYNTYRRYFSYNNTKQGTTNNVTLFTRQVKLQDEVLAFYSLSLYFRHFKIFHC